MATFHVEFSVPALRSPYGSSIHGKCSYYEALTISGTAAISQAATALQRGNEELVGRFVTEAACYFAVGSAPDVTRTSPNNGSSAKRYLAAGAEIDQPLQAGDKIAVIAA